MTKRSSGQVSRTYSRALRVPCVPPAKRSHVREPTIALESQLTSLLEDFATDPRALDVVRVPGRSWMRLPRATDGIAGDVGFKNGRAGTGGLLRLRTRRVAALSRRGGCPGSAYRRPPPWRPAQSHSVQPRVRKFGQQGRVGRHVFQALRDVGEATALRPASQSARGWETKLGTNVTMQTPPLSASRASTSSGTLRGVSQTARAELCEKITGAAATSSASRIVSWDTCGRSTSMPIRCISRTTSPRGAR